MIKIGSPLRVKMASLFGKCLKCGNISPKTNRICPECHSKLVSLDDPTMS